MDKGNVKRYHDAQVDRSIIHPLLPQPNDNTDETGIQRVTPLHSFVVCSDTQLGMTSRNAEWETELGFSKVAVQMINELKPKPLYCCMCGDLVEMISSMYMEEGHSKEHCDRVQDQQNRDFQNSWSELNRDIALVCLCGNHDVGNRPTKASIERFKRSYGDDYLAFWANGTYNIVLNSALFSDPTGAESLYREQLEWLQERLRYARSKNACFIFVFGHHPWFLYHDDEDVLDLTGTAVLPAEWTGENETEEKPLLRPIRDSAFPIPKKYRMKALELFQTYGVDACFAGHFHQNVVSKSSFGMDMIITSSLSMVFESNGIPNSFEPKTRGIRVVEVSENAYKHQFFSLR